VIGIGESPVFQQIYAITKSLKIPYMSVRWENQEEEQSMATKLSSTLEEIAFQSHRINLHPPANKLMKGVTDLIHYYKWEYVTILYQESNGLNRIEDLIKLSRRMGQGGGSGGGGGGSSNNKMRVQVRQLSSDINKWIYLIKDVKLSGSSHIIVDIQTKFLNKFLEQVRKMLFEH
jgi:hypothetical protein